MSASAKPPAATSPATGSSCPICGRPTDPALRPFCSHRCADVDLGRWLGGVYRVESAETLDESDDGESRETV